MTPKPTNEKFLMFKFWALLSVGLIITFIFLIETDVKKNTKPENTALTESKNAHKVDAAFLANVYANNEIAADEKFKGDWFVVCGKISSIGNDIFGTPYVTLDALSNNYSVQQIQIMFKNKNKDMLSNLHSGEYVEIPVICRGKALVTILCDFNG